MNPTRREPGESPGDWMDRIDAAARRVDTPCGDGAMVWRLWGAGEPVVLLHGGSGSWLHWIRNLPALAQWRLAIAPDAPGLGDSAAPPEPFDAERLDHSMRMLAEITSRGLAEVVPAPARYDLVGFSMGAILAGYVAAAEPERVRRLVLVGASALGPAWPGLPDAPRPLATDASAEEQRHVHVHNIALILFGDASRIDDEVVAVQARNLAKARVRTHALARSGVLGALLPSISTPLAGIWGERDVYVAPEPDASHAVLTAHDPGARIQVIPEAGHWVMYEAADAFDRALLRALS